MHRSNQHTQMGLLVDLSRTALRLVVVSTVLSVFSVEAGAQDILRWNFRGRIFDVFEPENVFPDVRAGDVVEGFFQYSLANSGRQASCNAEEPPYIQIQNRMTTGYSNFNVLQFQIGDPKKKNTFDPVPLDARFGESETSVLSEDGFSLITIDEPFFTKDQRFGVASIELFGEHDLDASRMPDQLSVEDFDEVSLTFFLSSVFDDGLSVEELLDVSEISAVIFELEQVDFDPGFAQNLGKIESAPELPIQPPSHSDIWWGRNNARPIDLSGDGSAVLGAEFGLNSWLWSAQYGVETIPYAEGLGRNIAYAVSANGRAVVGELATCGAARNRTAYRWTAEDGLHLIGHPEGTDWSRATVVSADGNVVAGIAAPDAGERIAWTWSSEDGFLLYDGLNNEVSAMSHDGRVLVDFRGNVAGPNGVKSIGGLGDDETVSVKDISANGTSIVGSGLRPTGKVGGAFLWTEEGGMRALGTLDVEGHDRSAAEQISGDGKAIVGRSYSSNNQDRDNRAFIWDSIHDMRDLESVLETDYGISDMPEQGLGYAMAISDDRRVIAGYSDSQPDDLSSPNESWVFHLDWPLGAVIGDFSENGVLDVVDADTLVAAIVTESDDELFDLNRDKTLDSEDIEAFLARAHRLPGDANFDGSVDFGDFLVLSANFGAEGVWSDGDFDASGEVAFPDFLQLSANFGASTAGQSISVPESAFGAITYLLTGICLLHGRRKVVT